MDIILSSRRATTLKQMTDKLYPLVSKSNIEKTLTRLQQKMHISKHKQMEAGDCQSEIVEYRPCYRLQHRQVRR